MKLFILLAIFVVIAVVSAAHIHMEKTILEDRPEYVMGQRSDVNQMHEVIFAVKQNNLDTLEKYLLEVSTPGSPKYGKFLTREEVGLITSNPEAVSFIENYLNRNGAAIVKKTPYGEYITAKAPIALWEKLFATTFFQFKHVDNVIEPVPRCLHYAVEEDLAQHITAVFETSQLPFVRQNRLPLAEVSDAVGASGAVTPALINSFYNVTSNKGSSLASQSLFESLGQYTSPSDLTQFQTNYNLPKQNLAADIGGYVDDAPCKKNPNNCGEANLDVQYMMAVAQNVPTTYWYQGGNDIFTAWITAVAASTNPPLVHSISYGGVETATPSSSANSFNTEAMKLGTQGVSIFVSSGDDGAPGSQARNNASKCKYNPSFPATSPYVTAVGATQGPESGKAEAPCLSNTGGLITTGGGFSTKFTAASWQTSAISTYFKTVSTQPASGYATTGRGYPDLSVLGYNYNIVVGGKTIQVSGTSASSPVLAGFFSLINSARLAAGKKPLGFLNPAIYANYGSFVNDITGGDNKCTASKVCCTQGFYSAKGWDPVTGYGSVNYSKLYNVFFNL